MGMTRRLLIVFFGILVATAYINALDAAQVKMDDRRHLVKRQERHGHHHHSHERPWGSNRPGFGGSWRPNRPGWGYNSPGFSWGFNRPGIGGWGWG